MSTSGTGSRKARGRLLLAAAVVLAAHPARSAPPSEPLDLRGQATPGAKVYFLEAPFDDGELSSFFDQYEYIHTKNDSPAWFVDFEDFDLGLARPDDTYLVRFGYWSPNWLNDRAELDVDWQGLDLDLDYGRYRSDDLRVYPLGTAGVLPFFGTVYTPDTAMPNDPSAFQNPLGLGKRLFTRRTGVGGELALRPDGFGLDDLFLTEFVLSSLYETRKGWHQDRFLLDSTREPTTVQTARFRGYRRPLDQSVWNVGGGLIAAPKKLFTAALYGRYEAFREHAPVTTLETLAQTDSRINANTTARQDRPFDFVPDTDRASGALKLNGRLGPATLHGGGFIAHVTQAGRRSPLQDLYDLEDANVTIFSAHGAFETPIWREIGANGFVKYQHRHNGLDTDMMTAIAPPGQVDPFMRNRREFEVGAEVTWEPARGALVAVGYRGDFVDRDLDYSNQPERIEPEYSFLGPRTTEHVLYLRGRTRLMRRLQLSGEFGGSWSPDVTFPRDLEQFVYFEGRGSYGILKPFPMTLSVTGDVIHGYDDAFDLPSQTTGTSKTKRFDQTRWSYAVNLSAVPCAAESFCESLALALSFVQDRDDERFDHIRSNLPRYFDPAILEFFIDSEIDLRTDLKTLVFSAAYQILPQVDVSVAPSFTWANAHFHGSRTADILDDANGIRSRILSVEETIGYQPRSGLRFELGYRYDDYNQNEELAALSYDTRVHTIMFGVTVDLGLF